MVTGKTGDRRVRVVSSAPALATWMDFHPFRNDPDAYVWTRKLYNRTQDKLPVCYNVIRKVLIDLAKKAGIRKKINPHLFRHSRATVLANKLTEAQMKAHFGWVQGSDMAGVYVHLSGRDIDKAILNTCGMHEEGNTKQGDFSPVACSRCKASNSPASKFCTKCGNPLSFEAAGESERKNQDNSDLLEILMKDPRFQEMILNKLAERNRSEVAEVIQ